LGGRKRRPGVSNRRVFGRLGTSLGLFAIAVHIVIDGAVQAESTKLNCGAVNLVAVTGHSDGFKLIEHAPRVVNRGASRWLGCRGGPGGLVMLLCGGKRGGGRTGRRTPRVPRISSFGGGRFSLGRVGVVLDLVKVLLGQLIL
jgi:hypothetical protein